MKKNNLLNICVIALIAFVLGSCTMEKQHYSSGYYFHKNGSSQNQQNIPEQSGTATTEKTFSPAKQIVQTNNSIVLQTEQAKAISIQEIKTPQQNQLIRLHKTNAPLIKSETKKKIIADIHSGKKKETKKSAAPAGGGKSQLVALLLCIFFGYLGLHRFYLGYVGWGVAFLFTGGMFGIGWLIDLIRLITGGLKPKNGDYGSSL